MNDQGAVGISRDDRVLMLTRVVAVSVIVILAFAITVLYFLPDDTGQRFAWEIRPHMTAMSMGAGYIGGLFFFLNVALTRRWHRVAAGFLAITAFTWFMLAATLLHFNRFVPSRLPFQLWLGIYILTPLLVPFLWWRNRATDPGTPEPGDVEVPAAVRRIFAGAGVLIMALVVVTFVFPNLLQAVWPWNLTPLTARVLSGWFALIGVGTLAISRDARWSAWRVLLQSVALWQLLVLVAAALNPHDFSTLLNWYLLGVSGTLVAMVAFDVFMESRPRLSVSSAGTPTPAGLSR